MDEKTKQKLLAEKILLASSIIESNRTSSGNMIFANKWIIDNILVSKSLMRKEKIKKILNDKTGEI